MPKINNQKHLDKPRTQIRNKDYMVHDEKQIKDLLISSAFGSMASIHNDQPFLIPLLYVYIEEDHAIYFHGAAVGRTRANIEHNPNVCFNVTDFGRVLPAETIFEYSIEYRSATVFGRASRIDSLEERERVLIDLSRKFAPHHEYGVDYPKISADELKATAIFKIDIEEWSGKQNLESPDFPNAFTYPNFPNKEEK